MLLFFAIAIVGQNLDLVSKYVVHGIIMEQGGVEFIRGLIQFEWTTNRGIVFGIGGNLPTLFLVISVLAVPLIVLIFFSVKEPRWITTVSLGLILAGTLGNMYDRLTLGAVRDFIKVHEDLFSFPLFNLADSFICVGVFLMVVDILFFDVRARRRAAREAAQTQPEQPAHEANAIQGEIPPG